MTARGRSPKLSMLACASMPRRRTPASDGGVVAQRFKRRLSAKVRPCPGLLARRNRGGERWDVGVEPGGLGLGEEFQRAWAAFARHNGGRATRELDELVIDRTEDLKRLVGETAEGRLPQQFLVPFLIGLGKRRLRPHDAQGLP